MSALTVADYRNMAGVTQAEMASQMQIPLRTYEDIEAGRATFRPLHTTAAAMALIRIAVAKQDASFLPAGIAGLVLEAGKLVEQQNPSDTSIDEDDKADVELQGGIFIRRLSTGWDFNIRPRPGKEGILLIPDCKGKTFADVIMKIKKYVKLS